MRQSIVVSEITVFQRLERILDGKKVKSEFTVHSNPKKNPYPINPFSSQRERVQRIIFPFPYFSLFIFNIHSRDERKKRVWILVRVQDPDREIENSGKTFFKSWMQNFCYIQVIGFNLGYLFRVSVPLFIYQCQRLGLRM